MRTIAIVFLSGLLCFASAQAANLNARQEVSDFIDYMVEKHRFERGELDHLFAATQFQQPIIDAISRPAEALPWHKYRQIFVKPDRIQLGTEFWRQNAQTLARAEQEFGVPPQIITAIIGVETRYGQHKGKHRVMDALATLAFGYPKRSAFFKSELEHYLLLTRDEGIEPLSLTGSYAGAMGIPQFISSSYRAYAVDFDDDGLRDLWSNPTDAIGSVANYFKQHGWIKGEQVVVPATVESDDYQMVLKRGIKPHTAIAEFAHYKIAVNGAVGQDMLGALIELEQSDHKEHWVGLENFYAITRYNHSPLYAMAVYQLSQEIKKAWEKETNPS